MGDNQRRLGTLNPLVIVDLNRVDSNLCLYSSYSADTDINWIKPDSHLCLYSSYSADTDINWIKPDSNLCLYSSYSADTDINWIKKIEKTNQKLV